MKMSKEKHSVNVLENALYALQSARLSSQITGEKITGVDFKGSDLVIKISNGKQLIISAIEEDFSKKPRIEFLLA